MNGVNQKQHAQLVNAAKTGKQVNFAIWDENPGVKAMRDVLVQTEPNTNARMRGAQQAFPAIKALWENLSTGLYGMMLPKPMKETLNTLFKRVAVDKVYAQHAYNVFPIICDRYGAGIQQKGRDKGKPRLNFVHMHKDPLCKSLLK